MNNYDKFNFPIDNSYQLLSPKIKDQKLKYSYTNSNKLDRQDLDTDIFFNNKSNDSFNSEIIDNNIYNFNEDYYNNYLSNLDNKIPSNIYKRSISKPLSLKSLKYVEDEKNIIHKSPFCNKNYFESINNKEEIKLTKEIIANNWKSNLNLLKDDTESEINLNIKHINKRIFFSPLNIIDSKYYNTEFNKDMDISNSKKNKYNKFNTEYYIRILNLSNSFIKNKPNFC